MTWFNAARIVMLALCLGQSACASQPAVSSDAAAAGQGAARDQIRWIPMTDAAGRTRRLQARVCRPAGDGPARLVVINHGTASRNSNLSSMQLGRCEGEAAKWFLDRGYVVVFALRRGYGATGGAWAEDIGDCANPDYVGAGIETARDIDAVVDYATALPFVRPDGAVVVGHSAGGWGTIAYAGLPHPKVAALVVMAGGRGGHHNFQANNNCRPDRLAEAAGHFGATAATPMLWIYAANDSFFAPPIADALHQAFVAAGGKAELDQLGPYDGDGHRLFFGAKGSQVWGPIVERYLARQPTPAG